MEIQELHPWEVSPDEARRLQRELRRRVSLVDRINLADVTSVAGVDNAYVKEGAGTVAHAAAVRGFGGVEVVGVVELPAQVAREERADGRLAGARDAHHDDHHAP